MWLRLACERSLGRSTVRRTKQAWPRELAGPSYQMIRAGAANATSAGDFMLRLLLRTDGAVPAFSAPTPLVSPDSALLEQGVPAPLAPRVSEETAGMRVLVVEDDPLVRETTIEALRDAGFIVVEAETGEEALERAKNRPDIALVDIQLPGPLDGWGVAERLRQTQPDIPVVYAASGPPEAGRCVPGSRYVRKPYSPRDLIVAICEQVGSRPSTGTVN